MFQQVSSTRSQQFLDDVPAWAVYTIVAVMGAFFAVGLAYAAVGGR